MSVNMPHLHTLFANALDPKNLHTVLLMTVNGAVVISASSVLKSQAQRTTITLAAVAVETWANMLKALQEPSGSEQDQDPANTLNEVQGGWVTVEIGNVFVYPVVRPSKIEGATPFLEQDTMFLLAVSGPEEAGWDLLEERAKFLAEHLAPIFSDYNDSMAETPPIGSSRLPSTPRQARV